MPLVEVKNPKPAQPWLKALRARVIASASGRKAKAAFCPTGAGGGQDNSCGNKGVSEAAVDTDHKSEPQVDTQLEHGKALDGSGRSEALKSQIEKFETVGIAGQTTERAYVYDHNGKQLFGKQGDDNHVQFSAQEISLMQLQGKATLTHNHPNGSPLSIDDIGFAVHANLAEVRAFGLDHGKMVHFSLTRPVAGWPDSHGMRMAIMKSLSDNNLIKDGKATTADVSITGREMNKVYSMMADNIGAKYQRQYE